MAAKFFTGLPLDGPDPQCVKGHGATALAALNAPDLPKHAVDHSHRTAPRGNGGNSTGPVPVTIGRRPKDCDESPLAGLVLQKS
jgi:hypothetical protein